MRRLLYFLTVVALLITAAILQSCDGDPELVAPAIDTTVIVPPANIELLKMNQLQAIGSHNSYRIKTYQPLLDFLLSIDTIAGMATKELDYTHEPLLTQFDTFNVRSVEIDIYNDPNGGQYYNRVGNSALLLPPEPAASNEPELQNPGMKVLHIIDVDYLTHHLTFVSALTTIKNWSDANPTHLPLIIMIEAKDDEIPLPFFTDAVFHDATSFDALDAEVQSVFGPDLGQVVTPDDFKGTYSTPNEAALAGAWPTLADSRGTIYFVLMLSSAQKTDYLAGHAALAGRTMFIFGDPGNDETAFTKVDNPIGASNQDNIQSLVQSGYMVRTRCDAGTWEARSGDYSRMTDALSSGAQILSTDYYRPDERAPTDTAWSDYSVQLPEGVARLNPVNGPSEFVGVLITD